MAEQRLIDANALLEKRRSFYEPRELDSIAPIASTCVAVDDIYRAPTIDAVPVVRCGECKHRGNPDICPLCDKVWRVRIDADGSSHWEISDRTVFDGFCHKGAKVDAKEDENAAD